MAHVMHEGDVAVDDEEHVRHVVGQGQVKEAAAVAVDVVVYAHCDVQTVVATTVKPLLSLPPAHGTHNLVFPAPSNTYTPPQVTTVNLLVAETYVHEVAPRLNPVVALLPPLLSVPVTVHETHFGVAGVEAS